MQETNHAGITQERLFNLVNSVELKSETITINEYEYLISSLKDRQQYDDQDQEAIALGISSSTWSLFGVVWPTSVVMALNIHKYQMEGKRVLEIGCGIGLCSIVLHRMGIDITASDYHPRSRSFLDKNVLGNGLLPIKYQTGNWEIENEELGKFDFVIGSDVLYQPAHAKHVSRFIDRHASDNVQVLIADPGRENRANFTRRMIDLGYSHRFEKFDQQIGDDQRCKGRLMYYQRSG
ncbi:MAG: methyltransferase domain-containing protein [Gammaproteobacteria bacterium]|nr:methyltransferase domain-containing protein [Gammaproteobacteria bacterium]